MKSPYDIIISTVITERSTHLTEQQDHPKYTFVVHSDATKNDIKHAIQSIWGVQVTKVNTINRHGKPRRVRFRLGKTAQFKKAIVTLRSGERIDFA